MPYKEQGEGRREGQIYKERRKEDKAIDTFVAYH